MSRTPLKTYPEASALLGWSEKGMYWSSWRRAHRAERWAEVLGHRYLG